MLRKFGGEDNCGNQTINGLRPVLGDTQDALAFLFAGIARVAAALVLLLILFLFSHAADASGVGRVA